MNMKFNVPYGDIEMDTHKFRGFAVRQVVRVPTLVSFLAFNLKLVYQQGKWRQIIFSPEVSPQSPKSLHPPSKKV